VKFVNPFCRYVRVLGSERGDSPLQAIRGTGLGPRHKCRIVRLAPNRTASKLRRDSGQQ